MEVKEMILDKTTGFTMQDGTVVPPTEIRLTDRCRHKYDSAMAEYLDTIGAYYEDEWTGSTEWCEYVQRFGKRLLFSDDRGFVSCERWPSEEAAKVRFAEIEAEYCKWADTEDEEEGGW